MKQRTWLSHLLIACLALVFGACSDSQPNETPTPTKVAVQTPDQSVGASHRLTGQDVADIFIDITRQKSALEVGPFPNCWEWLDFGANTFEVKKLDEPGRWSIYNRRSNAGLESFWQYSETTGVITRLNEWAC